MYAVLKRLCVPPLGSQLQSASGLPKRADDRRGGVGKETQIISEEVYNISQTKFLPIFCDVNEDGKPCLLEAFADFAGELPDKCAASIASTFISKPPVCTPPSSSGRRHAWERMAGRSACK